MNFMAITFADAVLTEPDLVSIEQKHELEYWTRRFGVSENQLRQAIEAVGDSTAQVEAWLRHQGQLIA